MVAGAAVLWRALVYFWDESLLLIRATVTWFVGSLPLYLVTVGICTLFVSPVEDADSPTTWPWLVSAFVLLLIPSPMSAGIYALSMSIVHGETPEFAVFWQSVRRWWKRSLVMYAIGAVVLGALIFNTSFYMSVTSGLLQAVAVLWVYAIIYWLTLQAYLLPLLTLAVMPTPAHGDDDGWPVEEGRQRPGQAPAASDEPVVEPSIAALYKRAAILALANPLFSLMLFFGTLVTMIISTFAMPIYPLLAMGYISLIGCQGLRVLRDKYFPTEARGATG